MHSEPAKYFTMQQKTGDAASSGDVKPPEALSICLRKLGRAKAMRREHSFPGEYAFSVDIARKQ